MLRLADIKNFSPCWIPSVLRNNIPVYGYPLNDLEPRSVTLGAGFYDNEVIYFIGVVEQEVKSDIYSDEKCAYFIDTKRNNLIWINGVSQRAFNFIENKDIKTDPDEYIVLKHESAWIEVDKLLIQYYKKKLGLGE